MTPHELTGTTRWAAMVIERIGEWGVGLLTLLENVFPPLPSEVILPLAGFLAQQGDMNIVLVTICSIIGAYLGALMLYGLGATLGWNRSAHWLSKLPLVDRDDIDKSGEWFTRHGKSSVFFGRLVPGVRSLISLPAGAKKMNLPAFSLFTIAGSGIWNTLLITLGAALGTQYGLVDRYSSYLDYAVYAALGALITAFVVRRIRRRSHPKPGG